MKNILQNLAVFSQYCLQYVICDLAGFRNCLAEYTVRSLSSCYGLLTAVADLLSVHRTGVVEECFKMVKYNTMFYKNGVILHAFGRQKHFWASEKFLGVRNIFSRGGHLWIFPNIFLGGKQNW